jgi:hypothetical protein
MKLFLSSESIPRPEELVKLIGKPANKVKVAMINNAFDVYPEERKPEKYQRVSDEFKLIGFDAEAIIVDGGRRKLVEGSI